jgi:hypothetical protein
LFNKIKADRKLLVIQLKEVCASCRLLVDARCEQVNGIDIIAAIRIRVEQLAAEQELSKLDAKVKEKYSDVFRPIPHVDEMPDTILCKINLKDASKTIDTRNYSCPRKFREAWSTLIQQHLNASRIRPLSSAHASPAFLVPKADTLVLPRWVNDYRQLNANTVTDSHPLPRVDDILADAGRGKIWSKLDMTDSFFHTKMDPESIHLTAVTTPLGLYEWLVMPQGLRNAPPVHQRRVTAALRPFLGIFAHIYLDDIIIWSNSLEEHTTHIKLVMDALQKAHLYCNAKKSKFYLTELVFLGHRISQQGIEACSSKVDKILSWPTPKSATDVRSFLELVRYIAVFLPHLADHTTVLTPLTTKECEKDFPTWSSTHQIAFDAIKSLVVSRECLTVIDHTLPGNNRIFVTCDASDLRTGAVLSWGPTWETARPVAFDSMQLNDAQKNYPVHEKEMLAIVRALKKWRSDLLGSQFIVYTDHRTLENFETQKDLSCRQARWMEHLSQFDMSIHYIRGEDNTMADALSRLPADTCEVVDEDVDVADSPSRWDSWLKKGTSCNAILTISADESFLNDVREGYKHDAFCQKLCSVGTSMPGVRTQHGLWYLGDRLIIPRFNTLREDLFRLAHDSLGHFGAEKSYANIRNCYYWPNMRRDLETAYVPACPECQRNKSATSKAKGPLHPLPVPDAWGDSVCLDFVGPLPEDEGYNCILTITDRLGSDVRLVPTRTDISAARLASIFFNEWYCENGLPLELISDHDKLFVSKFWKALHTLTGVHLKMSTAYHPQTDGASERTNKTLNQCVRYHVERNQKGWVRALPIIRFNIMNSMNASTGFSGFQIQMGRSPQIMPPLLPSLKNDDTSDANAARSTIAQIESDVAEAKDALLGAKILQAFFANKSRGREDPYLVGDRVMLATLHRRREYKAGDRSRVAKFFPRWDGPFSVTAAFPETSSYSLHLPNSPNVFPTFHASLLKRFIENDPLLFPSRELGRPGPVMTEDGLEEYRIEKIVDERKRGRGYQYLVRWSGYSENDDLWVPQCELEDCEALDRWKARRAEETR